MNYRLSLAETDRIVEGNNMNGNNRLYGRAGLWASGVVLGVLTGCTTYVQAPRPEPVYVAPPPVKAPEVVVTPPPPLEPPMPVQTVLEIRTERDFYEPLSPYGHWVETADYGRCWVPDRVDRDWRPYCNGHWQRTEAGWYWVSDEPWGWATYHYGRWDWKPEVGWLWVPQTLWAPAWVSFHQGGGYMGWAPLHPSARIRDSHLEEPVEPGRDRGLVFVKERSFLEPVRPATVVVNNTTIINQTVNITNIKVVNNTVINEGPRVAAVEQASGRAIQAMPVRELRRKQEAAVVAARPAPSANQASVPSAARPADDSRESKAQTETERRAAGSLVQSQAEAQRKAKETEAVRGATDANSQAQAEIQRRAREAELRATQAEVQRRINATNAQARAEAQRKAKETELKAAQADAERRNNAANARVQAETQRKTKEAELRTAQADAEHRANAANARVQVEAQRKAKEAELKAAQVEAERQTNDAKAKALSTRQESAAWRGVDAITSRIAAVFAADPALRGVHVVRSNGVVHLSGPVSSAEQKKRAGDLAQKIETARPVQNDLTVRP